MHPCNYINCSTGIRSSYAGHYKKWKRKKKLAVSFLGFHDTTQFSCLCISLVLHLSIPFWILLLQMYNSVGLLSCHSKFSQEITMCTAITLHMIYKLTTPKCISAAQTCSLGWLRSISNLSESTLNIPSKTCFLPPFSIHLNSTQSTHLYKPKTWQSTFIPYPEYI